MKVSWRMHVVYYYVHSISLCGMYNNDVYLMYSCMNYILCVQFKGRVECIIKVNKKDFLLQPRKSYEELDFTFLATVLH